MRDGLAASHIIAIHPGYSGQQMCIPMTRIYPVIGDIDYPLKNPYPNNPKGPSPAPILAAVLVTPDDLPGLLSKACRNDGNSFARIDRLASIAHHVFFV